MKFIELTCQKTKERFIGNLSLLQRVDCKEHGSYVVGWNNNGGFYVEESYDEIIELIEIANN